MKVNDRITYIEIMGREYPMCLTVGATKVFRNVFGIGIKNIDQLMELAEDGENVDMVLGNMLQILQILLNGGRNAVQCRARMAGEEVPEIPAFTADDLMNIYTLADIGELSKKIMAAISDSYRQEIEAEPVKNGAEAASASSKASA